MVTLGVDLSTQSLSVVAVDCDTVSSCGSWSFSFGEPECVKKYNISSATKTLTLHEEGRYSQPPGMFLYALDAVFQIMKGQSFDFSLVRSMCVSTQQHGHVYLNGTYANVCKGLNTERAHEKTLEEHFMHCYAHPCAPIWMTSNTAAQAEHLKTQVADILPRTGSDSPLRFTGAIVRKTAMDYPEDYKATERIHLLSSFFASVFSGNPDAPIDCGNGAGTSLMNYAHKVWDEHLLEACASTLVGGSAGLRAKFSFIESPFALCGNVARYFVRMYGFSPRCVVAVGSGDNPQTKVLSREALLSLGSSFVMMSPCYESAEDIVFHPHANAMYDGLARPFVFACRTNGALVLDRLRALYNVGIADGEEALSRISIGAHSAPLFWQPFEESFPRSLPIAWAPLQRHEASGNKDDFYVDYACLVDTVLALMSYGTRFMKKTQWTGINLTGGLAASEEVCMRISAFWRCPVVCVGSVGAGMGAAVCAAKAVHPVLNAETLAQALISRTKPLEAPNSVCVQAQEFTQLVQAYFESMYALNRRN